MPAIQTQQLSSASITADAALDIVGRHRGVCAGLRDAVVLIPDSHAAPDVARALREAAGQSVVLLPRITTLRLWAASVDPGKDRKSTRLNSSHT